MSYSSFLIANYATGFDKELQPWLLPNDAFTELNDGYVYRGVVNKRDGYNGYATGSESKYCESRMVHNISPHYTVTGAINGINDTYTINLTLPVIAGSLTIIGSNPVQVVNDDGAGNLTGAGTGTVVYATGVVSLVFTAPPAIASTITVTYGNFSVGDGGASYGPIMLGDTPVRRGTVEITAGAQVLNDNGVGVFTGDGTGTIDYTTGEVNITFNANVTAGVAITISYDAHQGLPVMGIMSYWPTNNVRQMLVADIDYVNLYDSTTDRLVDITPVGVTYNGGNSDFWGWVNYQDASSNPRLLFCNRVNGDVIQQWDGSDITDYAPTFSVGTLNARQIFNFSGRLVLFQTIEAGVLYPRRIRISGTGTNCDNFDVTATGAGFIDIDDNTHFFGAAQNRNDLLVFTEAATWILKFSGNDINPFQLQRIDGSRGSSAAFAVISYLNRTMAVSPRGMIMCDGYNIERMDDNLPQFTFNEINTQYFDRCFSAFLDEDRDVYLLYPSVDMQRPSIVAANASDRILVNNFEEDNFCIYNIPLSCMGNYQETIATTWNDLSAVPNWDDLATDFNNWNAFPFTIGAPLSIGGGHKGEVWSLNTTQGMDNPQMIRDITIVGAQTIQVTTDWNNYIAGDYIYFSGVGGMTEINQKQGFIESVDIDYTTFTVKFNSEQVLPITNAWTSGGTASRCIPFEAISKKLNPWVDQDKKVRCGWMYFYVSVSNNLLEDISGDPVDTILFVDVITSNNNFPISTNPSQKTYKINCTNINDETYDKKWVKIWINQVGQFLQFRMYNNQAGAQIQVHAMMAGFQPIGRLI